MRVKSQAQWHASAIPAPGRWGQEEAWGFLASQTEPVMDRFSDFVSELTWRANDEDS